MKHLTTSLCIILILISPATQAGLGDRKVAPQAATQVNQKAASATYTINETVTDVATVREYTDAQGYVFAVTWRGSMPDLSSIFSGYYQDYMRATQAQNSNAGRKVTTFESGGVVIRQSGHMRDLRGRAYLKDQLPPSVKPEDLK
jgi:hypothetical protein